MLYARPRRRRPVEAETSFDSLLDTMTNVVGILVILLAVTQLGVRDAVLRIDASLPEVSAEELAALQTRTADLEQLRITLSKQAEALPAEPNIAPLQAELKRLEKQAEADPFTRELNALQRKVDAEQEREEKLQQELATLQETYGEQRNRLSQLARTAGRVAPAVIQLPDPRPAPKKAEPVYVWCREGKVVVVDPNDMRERVLEAVINSPAAAGVGRLSESQRDKRQRIYCDRDKLAAFIQSMNIAPMGLDLSFVYVHERRHRHLAFDFGEEDGESMRTINLPTSAYQAQLRTLKGKPVYFRFLVDRHSFETYLKARQLSERAGIPAGWTLHESDRWKTHMDWRLRVIGELPPPENTGGGKKRPPANVLD